MTEMTESFGLRVRFLRCMLTPSLVLTLAYMW